MTEPGSGGYGAHGEAVDPLPQRHFMRRVQNLLPTLALRRLPSRHRLPLSLLTFCPIQGTIY